MNEDIGNAQNTGEARLKGLIGLRVLVWMREVLIRAGCNVSRFRETYTEAEAKKLIAELPALSKSKKTQMPKYAEFVSYLRGTSPPTEEMVERIALARSPTDLSERPFKDTPDFYLNGPYGFNLWAVLDEGITACQEIVRGEVKMALAASGELSQRVLKKSLYTEMRRGLPTAKKISVLRQTLMGLDSGANYRQPDLSAIMLEGLPHPITECFSRAVMSGLPDVLDAWRSYFVSSVAVWRVAEEGDDSRDEVDFILTGMLAGPVHILFVGSGREIRDFIMDMVIKHLEAKGKSKGRHLRFIRFAERVSEASRAS
ncbi:hypothetical protein [Paraburkholderia sediminicola]|uniref:hypothetical protein n=1 Tax=Paraburkholderia sediminicola TaxID=458836 RepID=UPI0038B81499